VETKRKVLVYSLKADFDYMMADELGIEYDYKRKVTEIDWSSCAAYALNFGYCVMEETKWGDDSRIDYDYVKDNGDAICSGLHPHPSDMYNHSFGIIDYNEDILRGFQMIEANFKKLIVDLKKLVADPEKLLGNVQKLLADSHLDELRR